MKMKDENQRKNETQRKNPSTKDERK